MRSIWALDLEGTFAILPVINTDLSWVDGPKRIVLGRQWLAQEACLTDEVDNIRLALDDVETIRILDQQHGNGLNLQKRQNKPVQRRVVGPGIFQPRQFQGPDRFNRVEMDLAVIAVFHGGKHIATMRAVGGKKEKELAGRLGATLDGKSPGSDGLIPKRQQGRAKIKSGEHHEHGKKERNTEQQLLPAVADIEQQDKGKNNQAIGAERLDHEQLVTDQASFRCQTGEEQQAQPVKSRHRQGPGPAADPEHSEKIKEPGEIEKNGRNRGELLNDPATLVRTERFTLKDNDCHLQGDNRAGKQGRPLQHLFLFQDHVFNRSWENFTVQAGRDAP